METLSPVIELKPVKSSNIKAVGFDEEQKILAIEFPSGIYHYPNVPKEVYESLIAADSIGKHFAAFVRPKFAGIKVVSADAAKAAEKREALNVNAGSSTDGNLSA